ncbi:hypothetical protein AcV7_001763 [Taiwanofungus camphoratus]|nr:hypothetical protein AcV7_001763 [Antrodia cinnamomea]
MVSIRDLQSSVHLKLTVSPGQGGADMFFTVYDLLALVRDQTSLAAHALAARGAELHTVNASSPSAVTKAFGGADVVVNVFSSAPVEYKNALVEAVKAWCQTTNESSSNNNLEWSGERAHIRYARKRSRSSHSTPAPFSKAPPGSASWGQHLSHVISSANGQAYFVFPHWS